MGDGKGEGDGDGEGKGDGDGEGTGEDEGEHIPCSALRAQVSSICQFASLIEPYCSRTFNAGLKKRVAHGPPSLELKALRALASLVKTSPKAP